MNVLIAGSQGAWFNFVSRRLASEGWAITWPDQDISIRDGQLFLQHNYQNIEVHHIYQHLLSELGISWVSMPLPRFYSAPYPGPAEFVAKFCGAPVVVSGMFLMLFLDLWVGLGDVVVDIRATEEEDLALMCSQGGAGIAPDKLKEIRVHQLERYQEHLKLFANVFTMTNAEVRAGQLDGLMQFLNSTSLRGRL